MKLQIEIDLDNDAFEGDWTPEVSRILEELSLNYDEGPSTGFGKELTQLIDINGNVVGFAKIVE